MSNEKHDEFSSWRSLLGSRDALPEHGLDSRDRTWEKLTRRLGPPPAARLELLRTGSSGRTGRNTHRRYPAHWIAAACLLVALIPAALFFRSGGPATVRGTVDPAQARQAPVVQQRPSPRPAEGDIVFRSLPPGDHTRNAPGPRAGSAMRQPHTMPLAQQTATPMRPAPSATGISVTTMPPAVQPAAASREKPPVVAALSDDSAHKRLISRQLRVVHINEIDNSNYSGPAITSTDRRPGDPDIKVLIILKTRQ